MKIVVPVAWEDFVQQQIDTKRFKNAAEVIQAGLQILKEHEAAEAKKLDELRRAADIGFDQIDRGRYIEGKEVTVETIRERAIKRLGKPTPRKTA